MTLADLPPGFDNHSTKEEHIHPRHLDLQWLSSILFFPLSFCLFVPAFNGHTEIIVAIACEWTLSTQNYCRTSSDSAAFLSSSSAGGFVGCGLVEKAA